MTTGTAPLVDDVGLPDILELDERVNLADPGVRAQVRETLEAGDLVFLHGRGFHLTERERQIITDSKVMFRGREEASRRNGRPTLTFDVGFDRLLFTTIRSPEKREIEAMLRRYAVWSRDLLRLLVPDFAAAAEQNRIIYRPVERGKTQDLHVDATYLYPTQGRSKLRIFCNIDPAGRPRVWQVGERFENYARRFLPAARGARSWPATAVERLACMSGLMKGRRTRFDYLLLDIRQAAKADPDYQRSAPRRVVDFPVGSTWIALTDLVLHGGISGQHAIDQVFFLPPAAMRHPERSALNILERLCDRNLV
jgi:3-deoxy-D-manno-oct-2-ulosonic acid (Kdo) hydroxylase